MNKLIAGTVAVAMAVLVVWGSLSLTGSQDAHAQAAEGYEYAFLLPVGRMESYDIELNRWAGKPADKDYHNSHVFAYEEGSSDFERRVNCLRRMNELGAQGWDMVDAKAGLLRRAKK